MSRPGSKSSNAVVISDSEEDAPRAKFSGSSSAKKPSSAAWAAKMASASSTASTSAAPAKRKPSGSGSGSKRIDLDGDSDDDDDYSDDAEFEKSKPPSKRPAVSKPAGKKATASGKSAAQPMELDSDSDDDNAPPAKGKGKGKSKSPSKSPGKKKEKKEPVLATDNVVEGISVAEAFARFAPEPPPEGEKQKSPFGKKDSAPVASGSKDIPIGAPNCLAAYNMVFTGELSSLSRTEAQDLAKRYGAKVTGAPSSKTTHVVMGDGAGPSKLKKLEKLSAKIVDEDGFLELIRKSKPGELDEQARKKIAEEEKKIKDVAREMEQTPKKDGAADGGWGIGAAVSGAGKATASADPSGTLWTTKYAPRKLKDLVGNKSGVEKLQKWLENFPRALKSNFKKPGPDGSGIFRAVLISGNPGIGKTSAAHLVSRSLGYTPLELNASDARSKKLVELALKDAVNNTNLQGWMHGRAEVEKTLNPAGVRITNKTVLIMDEIDGMSGGDRGGVGAINALIKKTRIPIICICNEARSQKLKPLEPTTYAIKFRKPDAPAVKSRMMSVAHIEGMKVPQEVMSTLIEASQGDIRLVLNMLSTWALSQKTMNFDESKAFGEANMKPGMHTPFTLFSELVGPYMFSHTCRKTLNEKADYYFQDPSLMPLLMQENYIRQKPSSISRIPHGPEREAAAIDLMCKAAESISDGDVIDNMIHGPQQHWSLMPLHAIASCVRPAFHTYGMTGGGFPSFPSWLGQNSKAGKLRRLNTDVQTRMRLAASASADEVRLTYQPVLLELLVNPLIKPQDDSVKKVIEVMDEYFLGLDDRDAIIELGIGRNSAEKKLKEIESKTKAAFTREYNKTNHPVAFSKAVDVAASKVKVLAGDAAPDVEEAFEPEEPEEDDEEPAETGGIDKDKLIKEVKPKAAKGKGKAKK